MTHAGEVYLIETPLPGEASGGRHLSVVISSDSYNSASGRPVLAAIRGARPNAYRVRVKQDEFTPAGPGRPLDRDRVVGLDQCRSFESPALGELYGRLANSAIERIKEAILRQFQIASPPYQRRGEVWRLSTPHLGHATVVLVLNDRSLATTVQQQTLALPFDQTVQEFPLLLVSTADLQTRCSQLDGAGQGALDAILRTMFGLA